MNSIITSVIVLICLVASVRAGGVPNVNCATSTNPNVLVACPQDCQNQHGAYTGYCGNSQAGDYNCYCDGKPGTVPPRSTLQCKEMTDGWRNVCTNDCICNHAADGGYCSWDLGICNCINYGGNVQNMGCPANSSADYLQIGRHLTTLK